MSFSSAVAITGTPDFGLIHIDPEEVAKALQTYLNTGSRLTGVSLDDINRAIINDPENKDNPTLVDLLKVGMKLFDAIVWLTAGKPKSHPLEIDPGMKVASIPSLHNVAKSVFYCYFMLVTQARYPVSKNASDKPKIPNFLRTIMGMDKDQHTYVETICSFEPVKFDPAWAKYVHFSGFGQETLSRFGLGTAGYRLFGPFKLYSPKAGLSPELMNAYNFARTVAMSPATWDVHPLTRNPTILTKRGNLNKNLANLILECFTDEQIAEMTKVKIIYEKPQRDANHRNYVTWDARDDISGTTFIFSST
jgi:hypothetical protein